MEERDIKENEEQFNYRTAGKGRHSLKSLLPGRCGRKVADII